MSDLILRHFSLLEIQLYFLASNLRLFLISNFLRVLNVVCFLLGNSPASECYMPTFRNTLFHLHRWCKQEEFLHIYPLMKMEQTECSETLAYKIRRRGITQKKAYSLRLHREV